MDGKAQEERTIPIMSGEASAAAAHSQADPGRRPSRVWRLLPWIVATVAIVVGAGFAFVTLRTSDRLDDTRAALAEREEEVESLSREVESLENELDGTSGELDQLTTEHERLVASSEEVEKSLKGCQSFLTRTVEAYETLGDLGTEEEYARFFGRKAFNQLMDCWGGRIPRTLMS